MSDTPSDELSWDDEAAAAEEAALEASVQALVAKLAEAELIQKQNVSNLCEVTARHEDESDVADKDQYQQPKLEWEGQEVKAYKDSDEALQEHQFPQGQSSPGPALLPKPVPVPRASPPESPVAPQVKEDAGEVVVGDRGPSADDQMSLKSFPNPISSACSSCVGDVVQIESARTVTPRRDLLDDSSCQWSSQKHIAASSCSAGYKIQIESLGAVTPTKDLHDDSRSQLWSPQKPTESAEALSAKNLDLAGSSSVSGRSLCQDLGRDSLDLSTGKENFFQPQPNERSKSTSDWKPDSHNSLPTTFRMPLSEMQAEMVVESPLQKLRYDSSAESPSLHITPRNLFGVDISPVIVVDDLSSDLTENKGRDELLLRQARDDSMNSEGWLLRDSPVTVDSSSSSPNWKFISPSPPRYRARSTPSTTCSDAPRREVAKGTLFWELPIAKDQPLRIETSHHKHGTPKYLRGLESSPSPTPKGARTHHMWSKPILGGPLAQRPPGARARSSTPRNHDNWRKSLQNARRQGDRSPAGSKQKPWR